jgi:hypothetical protein
MPEDTRDKAQEARHKAQGRTKRQGTRGKAQGRSKNQDSRTKIHEPRTKSQEVENT